MTKMQAGAIVSTLAVFAALTVVFMFLPLEAEMLESQKIFYFHVSFAFTMFLACIVTAVAGGYYLARGCELADAVAGASAEAAFLFASIVLLTGMFWARSSWNVWWNWEPRLTSMLALWAIYAGYLLFRANARGEARRRLSSVYGIAACVMVPIVYYSIKLWGSRLHPPQGTIFNMEGSMQVGLLISFAAVLCVYAALMALRARIETAERRLESLWQNEGRG